MAQCVDKYILCSIFFMSRDATLVGNSSGLHGRTGQIYEDVGTGKAFRHPCPKDQAIPSERNPSKPIKINRTSAFYTRQHLQDSNS